MALYISYGLALVKKVRVMILIPIPGKALHFTIVAWTAGLTQTWDGHVFAISLIL